VFSRCDTFDHGVARLPDSSSRIRRIAMVWNARS
jgi:hypothetical protein